VLLALYIKRGGKKQPSEQPQPSKRIMLEKTTVPERFLDLPMWPHNVFYDKVLVPAKFDGAELCAELSRTYRTLSNQKYFCPDKIWIYRQIRSGQSLELTVKDPIMILALKKTR
jgi:hypothetical protein